MVEGQKWKQRDRLGGCCSSSGKEGGGLDKGMCKKDEKSGKFKVFLEAELTGLADALI